MPHQGRRDDKHTQTRGANTQVRASCYGGIRLTHRAGAREEAPPKEGALHRQAQRLLALTPALTRYFLKLLHLLLEMRHLYPAAETSQQSAVSRGSSSHNMPRWPSAPVTR